MNTLVRMIPIIMLMTLSATLAGCDWIGDPWVTDPHQYAKERSRSDRLHDHLIDRAERGQTDR